MKRVLSVLLILTFVLSLGLVSGASAVGGEVKLLYVNSKQNCPYAWALCDTVSGGIDLENIAYTKVVTVIFYDTNNNQIDSVEATYVASTGGNRENWKFTKSFYSFPAKLAVKYEVNGSTYWDSNNGNNYNVSSGYNDYLLVNSVVKLTSEYPVMYGDTFSGSIQLQSYDNNKTVTVYYRVSGSGSSFSSANASYSSSISGTNNQLWNFSISGLSTTSNYEVYIDAVQNSIHYYDNNLNSANNYTVVH